MFDPFDIYELPNTLFGMFLGILLLGFLFIVYEMYANKTPTAATTEHKITDARIQHFTIDGIECIAINRYGISCDWHNRKLSGVTK